MPIALKLHRVSRLKSKAPTAAPVVQEDTGVPDVWDLAVVPMSSTWHLWGTETAPAWHLLVLPTPAARPVLSYHRCLTAVCTDLGQGATVRA